LLCIAVFVGGTQVCFSAGCAASAGDDADSGDAFVAPDSSGIITDVADIVDSSSKDGTGTVDVASVDNSARSWDALELANPVDAPVQDGAQGADVFVRMGPNCSTASACQSHKWSPYCDSKSGTCVQCLVDWHCLKTSQICSLGKCVAPPPCTPDQSKCVDGFLATCDGSGKTWVKVACPDSKPVCAYGACGLCAPSKVYCAPPEAGALISKQVLKCAGSGQKAILLQQCAEGDKCVAGECVTCTPGVKQCQGDKLRVCKADGSGWKPLNDCSILSLACVMGACAEPCSFATDSNEGCRFTAVDLRNYKGKGGVGNAHDAPFGILIANPHAWAVSLAVTHGTNPGQKQATYTVPANAQLAVELPPKAWGVAPIQQDDTSLNNRSYGIKANAHVAVWQMNPLLPGATGSNDGTLLLPEGLQGEEYFVVGRRQGLDVRPASLAVVATTKGKTHLKVVTKTPTFASTAPGAPVPIGPWPTAEKFTLEQGDVLHLVAMSYGDLTGTWIKASSPVAVFSSSAGARSPDTDICVKTGVVGKCQGSGWPCQAHHECPAVCCASHIETQLLPVSNWGWLHLAMRSQPRGESLDSWRVTAAQHKVQVKTVPQQVPMKTLNMGQSFEFQSAQDFTILTTGRVQVAWTLASSHAPDADNDVCQPAGKAKACIWQSNQTGTLMPCHAHLDCPNIPGDKDAKVGEAAFTIVPAKKLWREKHTVVVPAGHASNYLNVGISATTTVSVDGKTVDAGKFEVVAGTSYMVARLPTSPGAHVIEGSNKISVMLYGWDQGSGYAMAGGRKKGWPP